MFAVSADLLLVCSVVDATCTIMNVMTALIFIIVSLSHAFFPVVVVHSSFLHALVVVAVNSYFQHLISNIDNNWYVCQNASALVSGRTTFLSISSVRRANVALACHDISDVSATSFSIVKMLCTPNTAPIETANIIIASTGDLRKEMRNANDNVRTPIASLGTHFVFALLRTKISSLNFS